VQAQPTTISNCPTGFTKGFVNVKATVSTNPTGCPLLQDKNLSSLVAKGGMGITYLFPEVPCLSGTIFGGTITIGNTTYTVTSGFTESAQQLIPQGLALDPGSFGVFLTGANTSTQFAVGTATTLVSLKGENVNNPNNTIAYKWVLEDLFAVNLATGDDYERFDIKTSDKFSVVGRLQGAAKLNNPFFVNNDEFSLSGPFCIK